MVVNPAYKGISLPVDQWPLLSTYQPSAFYQTDLTDCLSNRPSPFSAADRSTAPDLEAISQSLQFDRSELDDACSQPIADSPNGREADTASQETPGEHFMIGITPLADDQRYGLRPHCRRRPGTFVAPQRFAGGGRRTLSSPIRAPTLAHPVHTVEHSPARPPIPAPSSSTPPSRPSGCPPTMPRSTPPS